MNACYFPSELLKGFILNQQFIITWRWHKAAQKIIGTENREEVTEIHDKTRVQAWEVWKSTLHVVCLSFLSQIRSKLQEWSQNCLVKASEFNLKGTQLMLSSSQIGLLSSFPRQTQHCNTVIPFLSAEYIVWSSVFTDKGKDNPVVCHTSTHKLNTVTSDLDTGHDAKTFNATTGRLHPEWATNIKLKKTAILVCVAHFHYYTSLGFATSIPSCLSNASHKSQFLHILCTAVGEPYRKKKCS